MYQLFLFLHILGAILAFGFGFTVPVIGRMLATEPQHGGFFIRASKRVSEVILIPAAISMAISGIGLIATSGHSPRELWLGTGIVIYIGALLTVFFVQRPIFIKLVALTSTPPGPGGPNPEIPLLLGRLRMIGAGLGVAIVTIVFLMVFKPFY